MPSVAQPTHRIWAHAAVAAALLLLTPALVAAIQWGLGGSADPDMSGVLELVARPEATAVLIAFFALVGTIVGAGLPHRTRVLN